MKKTLSLILALLMSVSCASFAFAGDVEEEVLLDDAAIAEEAEEEAVEVEEPTIYQDAIDFLNAYGIYKGYGADKMGANDDIQRYQMALFTSRIATGWVDDAAWNTGIWNASYTEFTDVNEAPAANYLGAISYANQNGIIEGYGDGRFGPTDGITYQNALTMVVRALGYQNLNWPWGYIEKAVTLGLTDGIVGVAYTDVLTRGEVAQVIYNALFAETKDGTTLGAKNFDIEFGWETIVITASDGAYFFADGEKAKDGIVAYKVLNENGTVGKDTFYTAAETFKFKGHQDELAVGNLFKVCFNKDGILFANWLGTETLKNFGPEITEVKDYLKDKTAVSKYTETTFVDKAGKVAFKNEIIIAEALNAVKTVETKNQKAVVIDWTNGNILVADEVDKDGNILSYKVEWYYNALLNQYYDFKTKDVKGSDKIDGAIEIIGYELLDTDKEIEDLLKKQIKTTETAVETAYNLRTSIPDSAYATLELFNLKGHDYGIYTSYRFGKISEIEKDCGHGKCEHVKIEDFTNKIAEATLKAIDPEAKVASYGFEMPICGQCTTADGNCEKTHKDAWWTDLYAPELDEESGKIEENFVIYNFNKATNELRVLATLGEAKTGVVRAFNLDKRTINIDGDTFYFDYDALEGNMFATKDNMNKSVVTKAITAAYLKGLFNQFVEYVVVDGKIVYVAVKGNDTKNWLVVESYAGVSNDGYIVVNAYSTKDLKLGQYRIGSYNGWEKGDYFYYLDDATAKDSFSKGVIYDVSSYDADKNVYYVELIGEFVGGRDYADKLYDGAKYVVNGIDTQKLTKFAIDADGYITGELDGKAFDEFKVSSDDKWILIGEKNDNYVPMAVYQGKVPTDKGWTIKDAAKAEALKFGDHLFILVNVDFDEVVGFNYDEYAAGFVVYFSKASAKYDMYDFDEEDGYYLLGASTYKANVFDLINGKEAVVEAQNVALKPGYVYITLDGKIVDDDKYLVDNVLGLGNMIARAYADTDAKTATADYLFGANFSEDWINKDGFVKKGTDGKTFAEYLYGTGKLDTAKYHKGLEISGKVINLVMDKGLVVDYKDVTKAGNKFWDSDSTYNAFWIYDVDAKSVVIYVWVATTTTVSDAADIAFDDALIVPSADVLGTDARDDVNAFITGTVNATKKVVESTNEYVDDVVTYTINSIEYEFDGAHTKGTHANIVNDAFFFGTKGSCTTEAWGTRVKVSDNGAEPEEIPVSVSIVGNTYDKHSDEDQDTILLDHVLDYKCNLVKSVKFDLTGLEMEAGDTYYVRITFADPLNGLVSDLIDDVNVATSLVAKLTVDANGKLTASFKDAGTGMYIGDRLLDANSITPKANVK